MHEPPHDYIIRGQGDLWKVSPTSGTAHEVLRCDQDTTTPLFYTGHADIEGNEIWEGDVIERCQKGVHRDNAEEHHLCYGLVVWEENWLCRELSGPVGGTFGLARALGNARVIGNQYEDPKLLET